MKSMATEYILKSPGHKFVPLAKKRGKIYKLEKEMKGGQEQTRKKKRKRKAREIQEEKETCTILIMKLLN